MQNLRMQEKLAAGDAIDLSKCERTEDDCYIMPPGMYVEEKDYCDAVREEWIWSIGIHRVTGTMLASTTTKLYNRTWYECIWLRSQDAIANISAISSRRQAIDLARSLMCSS